MSEADQSQPTTTSGAFPTPSWVRQRSGDPSPPVVPAQAVPQHDTVARPPQAPAIPEKVVWGMRFETRLPATIAAVVTALMTIGGLVVAAIVRAPESLLLPAMTAMAFVVVRTQLTASSSGRVSLDRSVLEVRTKHGPRWFDLARPDIDVVMSAADDDPDWHVLLDEHAGKPAVTLDRHQVPPAEFAPVVRYYRKVAAARAADRAYRHEQ